MGRRSHLKVGEVIIDRVECINPISPGSHLCPVVPPTTALSAI